MRKQKSKIYSIILLLIMVSSVIGLTVGNFISFGGHGIGQASPGKIEYNGYEFTQKGTVWSTFVNNREAIFTNSPDLVQHIEIPLGLAQKLQNTLEIDTTLSNNDTNKEAISLSIFQFDEMIKFHSNIFVRQGLDNENEFNIPVVTCDDATDIVPVIYFQTGLTTNMYSIENCMIAEAQDQQGFLMIKDRLLYAYFGII